MNSQPQVPGMSADKKGMNISGASLTDSLTQMASNLFGDQVSLQIAVAVMKQMRDQQQQQASAMIKMIQSGPTLDGAGKLVNTAA